MKKYRFNTKVQLSIGGILYISTDSNDLSQHFKISWGFFKSPKLSKVLSTQLLKPCSSTLHFETTFIQFCWVYFFTATWMGVFADVFQCRHRKKNLFDSVIWGGGRVKEGKNNLLIHSGEWWGFNPTNSVVHCWSSAMSRRKKGAAQEDISSSITLLSTLCWQVSMGLVREGYARDGDQLHHLGMQELILTGEKQLDMGLN